MAIKFDKKKLEAFKDKKEKANKSSGFNDDNFVTIEAGKKYTFRLLPFDDDRKSSDPEYVDIPFLELFQHTAKDENNRTHKITCPTTYDQSSNGFKACKVCEENSKLYKSYEKTKSLKDKALYDLYKRKFHGYALVYVIKDPTTPENQGKVKMLHYTKTIQDFLYSQVLGVSVKKSKSEDADTVVTVDEDADERVGYTAFDLEAGRNLIMDVTKKQDNTNKREYNQYTLSWSTKDSAINVDEEELEAQVAKLGFTNYRKASTKEQIEQFYNNIVLGNSKDSSDEELDSVDTVAKTAKESTLRKAVDEISAAPTPAAKPAPTKKEAPSKAKAVEVEEDADEAALKNFLASLPEDDD